MASGAKLAGVGKLLINLRERSGLSLTELAAKVGIGKGSLHKYERNHLSVPVSVIVRLAIAVGEDAELLVIQCLFRCHPDLKTTAFGKKVSEFAKRTSG